VIQSAHAHRQLRSREMGLSSGGVVVDRSEFLKAEVQVAHREITKMNLAKLAGGIKHYNNTTRACNIQ